MVKTELIETSENELIDEVFQKMSKKKRKSLEEEAKIK